MKYEGFARWYKPAWTWNNSHRKRGWRLPFAVGVAFALVITAFYVATLLIPELVMRVGGMEE